MSEILSVRLPGGAGVPNLAGLIALQKPPKRFRSLDGAETLGLGDCDRLVDVEAFMKAYRMQSNGKAGLCSLDEVGVFDVEDDEPLSDFFSKLIDPCAQLLKIFLGQRGAERIAFQRRGARSVSKLHEEIASSYFESSLLI